LDDASPDVYRESLLVAGDEGGLRISVTPYVAIGAVENASSVNSTKCGKCGSIAQRWIIHWQISTLGA
jgi:hypothetical protein